MALIDWFVKLELHNNKALFHTASEEAQDWMEDNTNGKRWGTAYVVERDQVDGVVMKLKRDGLKVG